MILPADPTRDNSNACKEFNSITLAARTKPIPCPFMLEGDENPEGEEEAGTHTATKPQASFRVVLFNDESHTYDYVVEMLVVVCRLSREAAFRCAVEVDISGRTIVFYGSNKDCQDIAAKILNYGPDHRLPHSIGSMEAEVQGLG